MSFCEKQHTGSGGIRTLCFGLNIEALFYNMATLGMFTSSFYILLYDVILPPWSRALIVVLLDTSVMW